MILRGSFIMSQPHRPALELKIVGTGEEAKPAEKAAKRAKK